MFETERRIYCSQLGEKGVIRNSGIIDLLQDTSDLHLMNHPVLSPFFKETGSVMFLTNRQVDIVRRPAYGERGDSRRRFHGRKYLPSHQDILRSDRTGEMLRAYGDGTAPEKDHHSR